MANMRLHGPEMVLVILAFIGAVTALGFFIGLAVSIADAYIGLQPRAYLAIVGAFGFGFIIGGYYEEVHS